MDDEIPVASSPSGDNNANEVGVDVNGFDIPERMSSGGDVMREIESARELLTRIKLDVECSSEKQANLSSFMMRVATKESEVEAFISNEILEGSGEMVLEFDLLSGFLESEVCELENFMSTLQSQIVDARRIICSYEHMGEALTEMEEVLCDCEESLRQSLELVTEIKEQSSRFQKNLFSGGEETRKDNGDFTNLNLKIEMQTSEQQKEILRMLEKSLATELDLDQKLAESRQMEEYLNAKLNSSEHEIYCLEDESIATWGRLFEGENSAEVLMGISKELLGRLQILQLNLNGFIKREEDLRLKLCDTIEQFKAKQNIETERRLVLSDSDNFTRMEKVTLLEKQLKEHELNAKTTGDGNQDLLSQLNEMSGILEDLQEKRTTAESRADSAEAKCRFLIDSNMELNEELNLLRVASAEAGQEKQIMLDSTIKDMENLIDGLKLKVLKAETLAESAEDKCIILSESNSELNEELRFLRGQMDSLKTSFHQAEERKKATAKDIRIRTKLITDLVMQMALERKRLQKQISSLTKENKILVKQLHLTSNNHVNISHSRQGDKHQHTAFTSTGESKDVAEFLSTDTRDETVVGHVDSTAKYETVRNIDARQLNMKHVFMTILVLVISVFAASLFQNLDNRF